MYRSLADLNIIHIYEHQLDCSYYFFQSNDGPIEDLTPTAPALDTDAKMEEFSGAPETEPPAPEPINFSPEAVTVPDAGGIPVAAVAIREEE